MTADHAPTPRATHASPAAAVVTASLVVGSVLTLHALGRGVLAAPPLARPADLGTWLDQRDALGATFALVRLALLALAYHLVATTLLAGVGRILRRPRLVARADAWTLPMFRGAVGRIVGLGLSASTILAGPVQSAGASGRTVAEVVVQRVDLDPTPPHPASDGAIQTRLPDPTRAPEPAEPAPTPAAPPAPSVHVVAPGDHLWSISEAALTARLGRPPTDAELTPYWTTVVRANPQLADPDLVYPGEAVNVPPPP